MERVARYKIPYHGDTIKYGSRLARYGERLLCGKCRSERNMH
jgi:hypothetical protein